MQKMTYAFTILSFSLGFSTMSIAKTEPKEMKVQQITQEPNKYVGKKVSVEGTVTKASPGGNSFVIDGDGVFNDQILVVKEKNTDQKTESAPSAKAEIMANEKVRVDGTVRVLTVREVTTQYDSDLDPQLKMEWTRSMPVIVGEAQAAVSGTSESSQSGTSN